MLFEWKNLTYTNIHMPRLYGVYMHIEYICLDLKVKNDYYDIIIAVRI